MLRLGRRPPRRPRNIWLLVAALPALNPSGAERAEARTGLLAALPTADPRDIRQLVARRHLRGAAPGLRA